MPESAPNDMSKEHLSIEERQVARALEEARGAKAGRDWPASVEALRNFGKVEAEKPVISPSVEAVRSVVNLADEPKRLGPDYGDPYKDIAEKGVGTEALMTPEERERMIRERTEYTKGTELIEIIRSSDNPEAITAAVREFIAAVEEEDDVPDIQAIDQVRKFLASRRRTYKAALNPEKAKRMQLEKRGLVEKRVRVLSRQEIAPGIYEIPLEGEEVEVIRRLLPESLVEDGGKHIGNFDSGDLKRLLRNTEGRAIWSKTEERVFPPLYSKEQLGKLVKTLEDAKAELGIRRKVFTASILYGGSQAQLGALCGLWADGRYRGIGDKDWKSLVSLGELKEGEAKFGDKMETGLRILTLIGTGGGSARYLRVPGEFRDREAEMGATREERARILREAVGKQPAQIRNLFTDEKRFQELVDAAQENIFCDLPRDASTIENINKWIVDVVNGSDGDKEDTEAAVKYSNNLFSLWGIARQFDCRTTGPSGGFEPKGVPATDDIVKLKFFNQARAKDAAKGHPHGPDATMGQFPEGFSTINFLEYAKPKSDRSTFWKQWWEEGKHLKDLNWENGGNAWFRYNEGLMNFAGDPEGRDKGLFNMLMKTVDRPTDLINADKLRSLVKMVDKASSVWPDTGNKDEKKRKIIELVFLGNITTTFQNMGDESWKVWGVPLPGRLSNADPKDYKTAEKNRENILGLLKQVGIEIDGKQLDEMIKKFAAAKSIKIK